MANQLIIDRLKGIQSMLKAVHQSSSGLSDATTGTERAAFIDGFLSGVLPAPFRFGLAMRQIEVANVAASLT